MTRGLQPSDLIIVAARPSMGKTSLVLNMAEHAALEHGQTVGFFSLEMSKEQLFIRLLTSVARIDAHRLQTGTIGERDYDRLSQAIGRMSEAPIYHRRLAGMGVLEMRAKARRLASERGLSPAHRRLPAVDDGTRAIRQPHAGAGVDFAGPERAGEGAQRSSGGVVAVEPCARSAFGPPAAALGPARVGRARAGRGRRPDDFPAEMYPDVKEEERRDRGELIIAKQRNGPTGVVNLAFLREHTRFENLSRRPE